MNRDPSHYEDVFLDAEIDLESLTVVLVRGGTRADVLRLLDAQPQSNGKPYPTLEDNDYSEYAAAEVQGGVVAFEHTGYADPSTRVLSALSELGGATAATRSNIQAHERFGCAQNGSVEFDAHEFMYVDESEKNRVPSQLRPMFDAACTALDTDTEADGFHGCAMAAVYTGVVVTSDDLERAVSLGYHKVRTLTYREK